MMSGGARRITSDEAGETRDHALRDQRAIYGRRQGGRGELDPDHQATSTDIDHVSSSGLGRQIAERPASSSSPRACERSPPGPPPRSRPGSRLPRRSRADCRRRCRRERPGGHVSSSSARATMAPMGRAPDAMPLAMVMRSGSTAACSIAEPPTGAPEPVAPRQRSAGCRGGRRSPGACGRTPGGGGSSRPRRGGDRLRDERRDAARHALQQEQFVDRLEGPAKFASGYGTVKTPPTMGSWPAHIVALDDVTESDPSVRP